MKKVSLIVITVVITMFTSSCGVNYAVFQNQNQHSTQVHLASNNFKVVGTVSGSADVSYVFAFGGINKRQLYRNAYAEMMKSADLETGSRALANLVTEEHVGGVPPFYFKRTLTVSAKIIEFTE